MKNAIDILSMIDTPEQKRKRLFNQTCVLMQQLSKEGKTKDEIAEVQQKINLPIDIHLAVFGHFSEICKHGKILKK